MRPPSIVRNTLVATTAALLSVALAAVPAVAEGAGQGRPGGHGPKVQLEYLDRGLVAVPTDQGVFLSWRLLGDEVTGAGPNGMVGTDFRVYRDGKPIATVTDSTNYLDRHGTAPRVPGRRRRRRRGEPSAARAVAPGPQRSTTCRCASPRTASPRPASRTPTRPTT